MGSPRFARRRRPIAQARREARRASWPGLRCSCAKRGPGPAARRPRASEGPQGRSKPDRAQERPPLAREASPRLTHPRGGGSRHGHFVRSTAPAAVPRTALACLLHRSERVPTAPADFSLSRPPAPSRPSRVSPSPPSFFRFSIPCCLTPTPELTARWGWVVSDTEPRRRERDRQPHPRWKRGKRRAGGPDATSDRPRTPR